MTSPKLALGFTVLAAAAAVLVLRAPAGDLNPPAGMVGATGPSLTDISNQLGAIARPQESFGTSQYQVLIKVPDVNGDSTLVNYQGWIKLANCSLPASAGISGLATSQPPLPIPSIGNLRCTAEGFDIALPHLIGKMVGAGPGVPQMDKVEVVFLINAGESGLLERLRIEVNDCYLTAVDTGSPTDSYSFTIMPVGSICYIVTITNEGQQAKSVMKCFDVMTGAPAN